PAVARGAKKMGRKRPHPNTTVWLARSGRAPKSQIDIFFEVPGKAYRLLTEAEYEYATRGSTNAAAVHTTYSWGNNLGSNRANCNGCGSQWDNKRTAPVGSFPRNLFWLHSSAGTGLRM